MHLSLKQRNLVNYLDSIKFHTGEKLNNAYCALLSLADYRSYFFLFIYLFVCLFIYLFLFSYNCLHFLPIPPPHPSQSHLPPPPLPSPLILEDIEVIYLGDWQNDNRKYTEQ